MQTISVIIATYNSALFIDRAITSIYAQTYKAHWQVIVVDDGSTDGTSQKIKDQYPGVHYIYQPNRGLAAAHNTALKVATGEWVAFIDADDFWPADRTSHLMQVFVNNPVIMIAWGLEKFVFEDPAETSRWGFTHADQQRFDIHLGARLFRREAFEQIGLFDEAMRCSDDVDWFYRAKEAALAMEATEKCTLHYTQHAHGISYRKDVKALQVLQSLKKSLDRRRAANIQTLPQLSDYAKKP